MVEKKLDKLLLAKVESALTVGAEAGWFNKKELSEAMLTLLCPHCSGSEEGENFCPITKVYELILNGASADIVQQKIREAAKTLDIDPIFHMGTPAFLKIKKS